MAITSIGVDLGLTVARAAWVEGDRPVLLETLLGHRSLPAVVGIDKTGALHVGESARNQMLLWPERAQTRLRRLLGTSQRVLLEDKTFSAYELCAVILSQLKELTEQRLGNPVSGLVLAVPCSFTPAQRQQAADAAALAGFRTVRTVLEPVAVAAANGLKAAAVPDGRAVLVFDLGGRGGEVTLLGRSGSGDEASWQVLATATTPVGSELFDDRIAEHLCTLFERDHGISPRGSRRTQARLKLAAEWAKCTLSREEATTVRLPGLLTIDQTPLDLTADLTREQIELLCEDDVRRALEAAELSLRDARLSPSQLDAVLLSGGGAQLPLVGRLLGEVLVQRPLAGVAPEQAIALGAALLGPR
jgi:molecular chaperone DnaK